MPLVVPKVGAIFLLDQQNGIFYEMHLYKNDLTPDLDTVVSDFTEADFGGYAALTITGWSAAITVADHAKSIANMCQFTHDGGGSANNIYGYYVVVQGSGELVWAERDPNAPVLIDAAHLLYQVITAFTRISEFS